jgi:hypothetical protein
MITGKKVLTFNASFTLAKTHKQHAITFPCALTQTHTRYFYQQILYFAFFLDICGQCIVVEIEKTSFEIRPIVSQLTVVECSAS